MINTKHRDIPSHKTWNAPFPGKSLTLAMIDEVRFERPHITALAIASDRKRDDDTINSSLNWPDGVCADAVLLLVQRSSIVRELNVGVRIYRPDRSIWRSFFRWCLDHVLYCYRRCRCYCKLWIMSSKQDWMSKIPRLFHDDTKNKNGKRRYQEHENGLCTLAACRSSLIPPIVI